MIEAQFIFSRMEPMDVEIIEEGTTQQNTSQSCAQLHQIGALTDHHLPGIVEEEKEARKIDSMDFTFCLFPGIVFFFLMLT